MSEFLNFPFFPDKTSKKETAVTQDEVANGSPCHLDVLERAKDVNFPEKDKLKQVPKLAMKPVSLPNSYNLKTLENL